MNSRNKIILIAILILAFLGFLDSTYLTVLHYKNVIPPCSITQGCEKVLTSSLAVIMGIPLSMLGSFYFTLMFALAVLFFQKKQELIRKALIFFATAGIIVGVVLFYIQWKVLFAFCQYCLLVELILLLQFALVTQIKSSLKKRQATSV